MGDVENIKITFESAIRYANFSVNVFYINSSKVNEKEKPRHEVRLYCFWSFNSVTNIPNETAFYFKMIKTICENNPKVETMVANNKYLRDKKFFKNLANMDAISNYIIHSE